MVRESKPIPIGQIQKLQIYKANQTLIGEKICTASVKIHGQFVENQKSNQNNQADNHTQIVECSTKNYQTALVKCVSISESSESEDTETTMRGGGGGTRPRSSNSMLVRPFFLHFK